MLLPVHAPDTAAVILAGASPVLEIACACCCTGLEGMSCGGCAAAQAASSRSSRTSCVIPLEATCTTRMHWTARTQWLKTGQAHTLLLPQTPDLHSIAKGNLDNRVS